MVLIWSSTFTFGHRLWKIVPTFLVKLQHCHFLHVPNVQAILYGGIGIYELACCFKRSLVRFTPNFICALFFVSFSFWHLVRGRHGHKKSNSLPESGRFRQVGQCRKLCSWMPSGCPRWRPRSRRWRSMSGSQRPLCSTFLRWRLFMGVVPKKILGHRRNIL